MNDTEWPRAVTEIIEGLRQLVDDHDIVLASVDTARAPRVVTVESLYAQLENETLQRRYLFETAVGCARDGYHRPAIVMSWAAVSDRVVDLCATDGFDWIVKLRTKWKPIKTREDLVEYHAESQIIDVLRDGGHISKGVQKTLQAQLHIRNRAAHASSWRPSFNQTLGFLEDCLDSLSELRGK